MKNGNNEPVISPVVGHWSSVKHMYDIRHASGVGTDGQL
jgi:hypothetical protein